MPTRAFKRKARQGSTQDMDISASTSFQRLNTEKSSLTEKQILEIPQQTESKRARNVKCDFRKTEWTIHTALSSLSELSLHSDTIRASVGAALGEGVNGSDHLESQGPDFDQENVFQENVMFDTQEEFVDMLTGNSEGNRLGKRRTRLIDQPIQSKQHHSSAEVQQLAQTVARLERQQYTKFCTTSKMAKSLRATSI